MKQMQKVIADDIISLDRAQILTQKFKSPLYIYDQKVLAKKINILRQSAHDFQISYAIKANTNSTLVRMIKQKGIDHVDAVSPGEIYKAIQCGFGPENIMYTQNFASEQDIDFAIQQKVTINIGALDTLQQHAFKLSGKKIFIRINPQIGAGQTQQVVTGGPKSKFGIYESDLEKILEITKKNNITILGLHQHIGSNIKRTQQNQIVQTSKYIFSLLQTFQDVEYLNIGGGLGVAYHESDEICNPYELYEKIRMIRDEYNQRLKRNIKVCVQPGRFIVADCSLLLCKVTATKKTPQKSFIGTDTGLNHLLRPALYGSHHGIVNLSSPSCKRYKVTVCGNCCESGDILGKDIEFGAKINDIIAIQNAGAYGFSMSSNYNDRLKPAEVLLKQNGQTQLIRRRQTFQDLFQNI